MSESAERSQTFTHLSIPQTYEVSLASPLFTPWARLLLNFAGIPAGASVLDVASGTRVVAHLVAQQVGANGQVTASDISPAMLAVAQAKPSDTAIRYIVSPADAAATIWATPYGPPLAKLPLEQQEEVLHALAAKLKNPTRNGEASCTTFAYIARAVSWQAGCDRIRPWT